MHDSPVFRRPVSPTEWSYLAAARLGELMVIQLVVEGDGDLDARALAGAVARASRACPGSRLVRRGRTWRDGGVPARVVVADAPAFDRTALTGPPELTGHLAGAEDAPACEVLLLTGRPSTVVFRAAHAVMDLKGLRTWAAEVFRALRGEAPQGAADPLTDHRLLAALGPTGQRPRLGLDRRSPLGGSAGAVAVWRRRTVPGRAPAAAARVSAALAGAVGGAPARIMVPVDLRRHVRATAATGNLTLPVFLDVPPGQDPDTVHRRLLDALAERRELATGTEAALARLPLPAAAALVRASRAAELARHRHLASAIVSHAGRLDPTEFSTGSFTATTAYALPVHAPLVPFSVVLLELPGHTELVVSARGAADVGERCDALIDRIAAALTTGEPAQRERQSRPSAAERLLTSGEPAPAPPESRPSAAERLLAPGPEGLPPLDTTVVRLFRAQSARCPQATAVTGGAAHWSYDELDRRSDAVCAELLARGVRRGEVVGVLADRTAYGIAGVWGVLKAGAAFLPVDVRNPARRVAELLGDAQARFCLVEDAWTGLAEDFDGASIPLEKTADAPIDAQARKALVAAAPGPQDLAYVIYTSGSTGRPKGVQVEHRSLVNAVGWLAPLMRCDANTRAAYSFSPGFDLSLMQIFPPLLHGGAVVPVPGELDHLKLRDMYAGRLANTLSLTPTHLGLAARLGIRPAGIRALQLGGENLTAAAARRAREDFGPDCLVVNAYGPTEATLACTVAVVEDGLARGSAPIGVPVHRTDVSVLDEQRRDVPDGHLGELYVTGAQLARGYLGRPDLTDERFVLLPDGRRAYRTGDLVLRLPDGQLEYAGRVDDQVKIRGHRVEPAEVETALTGLADIAQAAVVARGRSEDVRALCAFVVLAPGVTALDEAAVRAGLARTLPPHLVPTVVRVLPALPETASGKTDRKALPDPFADDATASQGPGDERDVAAVTARIWSRVLRCEAASLDDSSDFHALGGDSLAVLEMLSALGEELLGGTSAGGTSVGGTSAGGTSVGGTSAGGSAERRLLDRLGPLGDGLTLGRVTAAVEAVRSEA